LLVTTRWRGIARHEWTLACGGALALAVLMIWILPPMVLTVVSAGSTRTGFGDPVHTIIGDSADPTGQAWLLAWIGHALLAEPARLWDTNAFYPDRTGLAFNDTLLGYAPAGLIGDGVDAAVLRYNTVFVLVFARSPRWGRTRWPASWARTGSAPRWPAPPSRTPPGGTAMRGT
jgi:hypothetical protein